MRLGRLGLAAVVTMLMGCATGEPIDDDGAGGTPAGGNSGTGGKADNPHLPHLTHRLQAWLASAHSFRAAEAGAP
ncbi:MAG: hypothetical protein HYZ29_30955 [Myxococcales bacterium]|nr:hypothetical protein [Myxococcales bacterium]